MTETAAPAEWRRQPERGSLPVMRMLAWLSLKLGRRAVQPILRAASLYYLLSAPAAGRHARNYLRRALGREPALADRYRHICAFASVILDRLFLLAGRSSQYRISVEGEALVREVACDGGGAILLGAHMGSFEVLRTLGEQRPGLRIAMTMYEQNARKMSAVLSAARTQDPPEILPLGQLDSMLRIRERLEQGALVGMLADRSLGEEATLPVRFLGSEARFPLGPMHMAALLRQRVLFMAGLYRGGAHYHLMFEQIADFRLPPQDRTAAVAAAVERYASLVERCCRSDPYNWFNFFDFWRDLTGPGGTGG